MASKLNPRASRLDLRPDLRVMSYPIKLDQREIAALAEINRQYRDGDIQVYTGRDRETMVQVMGAKTLDTGVEFLLGIDRVSGRYLVAPVDWIEQVARMTAMAIDRGMIPEPPEDPAPPPMPKSRAKSKSAFPGGKMRNPRYQPLDKARFIADLSSLWKGKDLPEAPRDYSLYPDNLNRKEPDQVPNPSAHSISPYSDPRLHDRIKDRILASDKGGRPGQWSARKAQLVAQAYEAAGGGYTGRRTPAQASLSQWTREDWGTRSGKPSIQGPAATGERYLPRAVRESMPDKVYAASTRAKRASIAAGRQFSPQPAPARVYTTLHRTRIA